MPRQSSVRPRADVPAFQCAAAQGFKRRWASHLYSFSHRVCSRPTKSLPRAVEAFASGAGRSQFALCGRPGALVITNPRLHHCASAAEQSSEDNSGRDLQVSGLAREGDVLGQTIAALRAHLHSNGFRRSPRLMARASPRSKRHGSARRRSAPEEPMPLSRNRRSILRLGKRDKSSAVRHVTAI